jgi:2-polyprenyl-3-methyl-5-hydroxy-6-metoxy-1,4-benzoquinol methylase
MVGELDHARRAAAEASKGTASDPIYNAVLKVVDSLRVPGIVMDFGAGTGSFSTKLCSREFISKVVAADLVQYEGAHSHTKLTWVYGDLNSPLDLPDNSFDMITSVEVIEHLENPRFLAREWFRLLKPGGYLVVSTPNNESVRAITSLVVRGCYADFGVMSYPAHITPLLRVDCERIFREAGFADPTFHFTDDGIVPGLTRFRWQPISGGLLKGLRFSDNMICVSRKPAQ